MEYKVRHFLFLVYRNSQILVVVTHHWKFVVSFSYVKGGVNAKELFGSYISSWIKEKHLALLESCKVGAV